MKPSVSVPVSLALLRMVRAAAVGSTQLLQTLVEVLSTPTKMLKSYHRQIKISEDLTAYPCKYWHIN